MNRYCDKAIFFLILEKMVTPPRMNEYEACTLKGSQYFVARYPGKFHATTGS